ncbi:hypothetical protein CWR48_10230 [Oceanobacillus arenosus]|uniref:Uncharacterized protein n=1 Tax=Oceanobacillus arenosus TaxID=1229153 RepID=A0A3D8PSJ2_9BACI|nr:hypothetical protein [Oceanobacillus arenosus]RDW18692.1 hypothetical protein CWR48_10230 [Oceanobacillus arenosus]
MKWKLRIPMMLFIFELVSGIHQFYADMFIFKENNFLNSIQYLGALGIIFYILEKTGVHEKRVNFLIGIL